MPLDLSPTLAGACVSGPPGGALAAPALACAELIEITAACLGLLRSAMEQQLACRGLSESQFSLLWACRLSPDCGISQNQLARSLSVSSAHVSGQVEVLRQRGWIDCHRSPHDRRRQLWRLTAAGHSLLDGLLAALNPWANALQRDFGAAALERLHQLLRELTASMLAIQSAAQTGQMSGVADTAPLLGTAGEPRETEHARTAA